MFRKSLILTAVLVLVLVLAGQVAADLPARGPRITFGGLVQQYYDPTGIKLVGMDTLICVFNPNNFKIKGVGIAIFDKDGLEVFQGPLLDHSLPITVIPPKGWAWTTLGTALPSIGDVKALTTKYTFVIYWNKPGLKQKPNRGLVAEIKEVAYTNVPVPVGEFWPMLPENIRLMSETSIGKGGVGYSGK